MTDKDDERLRVRPSGLDGIGAATAPCIRAAAGDGVTDKRRPFRRLESNSTRRKSSSLDYRTGPTQTWFATLYDTVGGIVYRLDTHLEAISVTWNSGRGEPTASGPPISPLSVVDAQLGHTSSFVLKRHVLVKSDSGESASNSLPLSADAICATARHNTRSDLCRASIWTRDDARTDKAVRSASTRQQQQQRCPRTRQPARCTAVAADAQSACLCPLVDSQRALAGHPVTPCKRILRSVHPSYPLNKRDPFPAFFVRLDPLTLFSTNFPAGALAGAASRTVVSPLERLKIILQVQGASAEYKGVYSGLKKMWQEEGFRGASSSFFSWACREDPGLTSHDQPIGYMRGNGINVLRIAPYSAVQVS